MTIIDTVAAVEAETESIADSFKRALGVTIDRPVNSSFSSELPFLQLAWDSTSLGALKTCPRYYYYQIVLGYVPRELNVHLKFGLEFHAALELYDRRRAFGDSHDAAMIAAVSHAIIATWNFDLGRPWTSDIPAKNRETLIRAVVWYLDQFENDPLETFVRHDGVPAVELSFRIDLDIASKSTGENFMLCGHLDRVVSWHYRLWIVDRKTTLGSIGEEYFSKYSPDNQMSCYALGGQFVLHEPVAGLIIDAGQTGATYTRFQRGIVKRTPEQLEEWLNDLEIWLRVAEAYAKAEYWPQNDKSCNMYSSYNGDHDTWRGGCPYKEVCGSTPSLREPKLKALYTKRTWDPLQTREI